MPVMSCQLGGKPGFKFGNRGHCYTYEPGDKQGAERARESARRQGAAEHAKEEKRFVIVEDNR